MPNHNDSSTCPNLTNLIHDLDPQPIASGGMGEVYVAKLGHGSKMEQVAVKVFLGSRDPTKRDDINRRFSREVHVWYGLNHPNIVPFYGVYRLQNVPDVMAMVSPWMHHGSINKYLTNYPTAPRHHLVMEIALGLQYLHSQGIEGIVHGDLKGNNVLIDINGHAMITDFGRAFVVEEDDCSTSLLTAAKWTAPEVLLAETTVPLSKASDVWSFAVTALEVYCGKERLWNGYKKARVILQIITGPKPAYDQFQEIPPTLWSALDRCWEKNVSARPSIDRIVRDLHMWISDLNRRTHA